MRIILFAIFAALFSLAMASPHGHGKHGKRQGKYLVYSQHLKPF